MQLPGQPQHLVGGLDRRQRAGIQIRLGDAWIYRSLCVCGFVSPMVNIHELCNDGLTKLT